MSLLLGSLIASLLVVAAEEVAITAEAVVQVACSMQLINSLMLEILL
jgi:hypothetical protein